MGNSKELQLGKAGEYLVCADLIMKGLIAYPSEQGLPYDVVLDNGKKLLKVQVKSTLTHRVIPNKGYGYYMFSKICGRDGKGKYKNNDVDVFALVALEPKIIAYITPTEMKTSVNFRVDMLRGTYRDEQGTNNALLVKQLHESGESIKSIAQKMNVNYTTIERIIKKGFVHHQSDASYLSDLNKPLDWFYKL